MSRLPLLFAISLLTSCTDTAPKTHLEFVKIEEGKNYPELIFRSSENLASAFKDKKTRHPIFGELLCSLSGDENLKFDHHLDFFANGSLDEIRQALGVNKNTFKASLLFWRAPAIESGSNIMLTDEEVIALLKHRSTIPCLYRMTIYLSRPYYTETMNIPTADILRILTK